MTKLTVALPLCAFLFFSSFDVVCSDPNPQKSAFNAMKHAATNQGLYTPYSHEYMDELKNEKHNKQLFPDAMGPVAKVMAVGFGIWGAYQTVKGVQNLCTTTVDVANKAVSTVNEGVKLYKGEVVKQTVAQVEQHYKPIIDNANACTKDIENNYGNMIDARNAIETLSYAQLNMLAAGEAIEGSGKTYFTNRFKAETERLRDQIQKQKTNDVNFVMNNMNLLKTNFTPGQNPCPPSPRDFDNKNNI